jgi:glycosyltransferase involved in cell wall biosynthesis
LHNRKLPQTYDSQDDGKDETPLVSVIITHRNRPLLLQQAIKSIQAQTYKHFEIVIIDDGSDDPDAVKYIQELAWRWWEKKGWRVVREPRRFLGAARNKGGESRISRS